MGRDSSRTHIHLHSSRHADIFEDFTTPIHLLPALASSTLTATLSPWAATTSASLSASQTRTTRGQSFPSHPTIGVPGASSQPNLAAGNTPHLPAEELLIPPQYAPINPEEEDDVVPDQHATFGITRARETREQGWRDVDSLNQLFRGAGLGEGLEPALNGSGRGGQGHLNGGTSVGLGGGTVIGGGDRVTRRGGR